MRVIAAETSGGHRAPKDFEPRPPLRGGRILPLSERFVFELAGAAVVLGDDVTLSAELVLVGG
jgi:hypothetical protein